MVRDLINKKMVTKLNYTLKHLIMKNKKILKWLIAGFIARDYAPGHHHGDDDKRCKNKHKHND
jgi:hypothetical protein